MSHIKAARISKSSIFYTKIMHYFLTQLLFKPTLSLLFSATALKSEKSCSQCNALTHQKNFGCFWFLAFGFFVYQQYIYTKMWSDLGQRILLVGCTFKLLLSYPLLFVGFINIYE